MIFASPVWAQNLPVIGGPTANYSSQTGYFDPISLVPSSINANGTAIGNANRYDAGVFKGSRAISFTTSGYLELGSLGTDVTGFTFAAANAINDNGFVVGTSAPAGGNPFTFGTRAVRWDSFGNPTQLNDLGTNTAGYTDASAIVINSSGVTGGTAKKYAGNTDLGTRAVRWDAGSQLVTELGHLGTDSNGMTFSTVYAINNSGTTVGYAQLNSGPNSLGNRPVRWDASGTTATQLDILGTSSGYANSYANGINSSGTVIGIADKYDVGGNSFGIRAVRWNAGGTSATELGTLGTNSTGTSFTYAQSINNAGHVVGYGEKYDGSGNYLGRRGIIWNSGNTTAVELGNIGTYTDGSTDNFAVAVNNLNQAVGYGDKYVAGVYIGQRAILWNADGTATDLNTLINPNSNWVLIEAKSISDNGWITGTGLFDPDGAGPLAAYSRLFEIQLTPVPEPTTFGFIASGIFAAAAWIRRNSRRVS